MATDSSGQMPRIIVESIYGGNNQIGGSTNKQIIGDHNFIIEGWTEGDLRRLITALGRDAGVAPPEVAAKAHEIAVGLEHELQGGRKKRVICNWVERATDLAISAIAMEATRKVLDAIT